MLKDLEMFVVHMKLVVWFIKRFQNLKQWLIGGRIRILSPRHGEIMQDRQSWGDDMASYSVSGTLRCLPENHEIWLMTEDERSGRIWPQNGDVVDYDKQTHVWKGRIITNSPKLKVHAVVAPPTSQDFFNYHQNVGLKTNWEPLSRVPPECTNRDEVQART